MVISGAIFDMDGTLVDSLMIWDVLWSKLGEKYRNDPAFQVSETVDKNVRTMTLEAAMEYVHQEYNMAKSGKELLDVANDIIAKFYATQVQLKPGVLELLDCLLNKQIPMCIASATDIRLIKIAMAHCGLEKYFPKIFSCADIGKGKDCPDIYLAAQEYLGSEIEETWVFEDSAVAVCTAHGIGMKTVGIFDRYNYGQDVLQQTADIYIAEYQTLEDAQRLIFGK